MWEVETEKARCLAYVVTVHQQTLGLVDYVCVYVAYGSTACLPMHHIAKITWGISQVRGTIGYGGQTERELAVLTEILLQQVVKAFQYVVAILVFFRDLTLIDAAAVFQYEMQIAQQDVSL